jgi:hypothetical protein
LEWEKKVIGFFIAIAILNKKKKIGDNWVYEVCIDLVGSDYD